MKLRYTSREIVKIPNFSSHTQLGVMPSQTMPNNPWLEIKTQEVVGSHRPRTETIIIFSLGYNVETHCLK